MIKIEKIENKIKNFNDLSEKKGIVFSGFDKDNNLLFEKGIIFTDKSLGENIKNLYNETILGNKKLEILVIDIIKSNKEIKTTQEVKNIDLLNEGVFIGDIQTDNGSFILPNTNGINKIIDAIKIIREKGNIKSKNVNIYTFKTKRIVIEK